VLQQGSSTQLFTQLQQLVSDQRYADWNSASSSSSSFSGSFSIPDEVDAAIGDGQKSNASSWGSRRSQFLSMNFQQTSSLYKNSNFLSQISVAALHEITQCAITIAGLNGKNFVAMLDRINDDRKSFAVQLTYKTGGNPNWSLTQFSVQPPDLGFSCTDGFEKASREHPIKLNELTQGINCSKSPNASLILVVDTTAGAAPAIALTSINEELQKLRDDMASQIQGLSAQVQIAAPSGRVLAFDLASCPQGWSKFLPAIGRFIRGTDPTAAGNRQLESLQDDAFQEHTFGDGGAHILRFNPVRTNNDPPNGFHDMYSTGIFGPNGLNPAFGVTTDAKIVPYGESGTPRIADETRPKNVALLYCKKD
jgi:hypothetical protein